MYNTNTVGINHPFGLKVLIVTHNDLDGYGCPLVASMFPLFKKVDYITTKNPDHASKVVNWIIENKVHTEYERVYITDISVDQDTANNIENEKSLKDKLRLIDHHMTATWLNLYDWANVEVTDSRGRKESGTSLLFKELLDEISERGTEHLFGARASLLSDAIRLYDTWEWKEQNLDYPVNLNDLFYLLGGEEFVNKYKIKCFGDLTDWKLFDDEDLTMLKTNELIKQDYINRLSNKSNIQITKVLGYTAGVVFADKYISELGNNICEINPELDLAIIIDMQGQKVSYRTTKDEVDVSEIAKTLGGGGHAKASGNKIGEHTIREFLYDIFTFND